MGFVIDGYTCTIRILRISYIVQSEFSEFLSSCLELKFFSVSDNLTFVLSGLQYVPYPTEMVRPGISQSLGHPGYLPVPPNGLASAVSAVRIT